MVWMARRHLGRNIFIALGGLLAAGLLYFLVWPGPLDPVAVPLAPAPPLTGKYAVNDRLASVEGFGGGPGVGPEDLAFDSAGRVYAGLQDPSGRHAASLSSAREHGNMLYLGHGRSLPILRLPLGPGLQ